MNTSDKPKIDAEVLKKVILALNNSWQESAIKKQKRINEAKCFEVGHDMHSIYTLAKKENDFNVDFGLHKCMRCGKEEPWKYINNKSNI